LKKTTKTPRSKKKKVTSSHAASRLLSAIIVGLVLLALAPVFLPAYAGSPADQKDDYALIFGTVWGPDNRPVYGIPVKIRRADQKKARWEAVSDHHGEFAQRVPTGKADYIIWADIKVPKGKEKPQVTVHIENNERVDAGLHLTE
jgi:hypothetical protein